MQVFVVLVLMLYFLLQFNGTGKQLPSEELQISDLRVSVDPLVEVSQSLIINYHMCFIFVRI